MAISGLSRFNLDLLTLNYFITRVSVWLTLFFRLRVQLRERAKLVRVVVFVVGANTL